MRFETLLFRPLPTLLLTSFCLLFITALASAQDEPHPPAPQFLYRSENRLVLFDGYTGEKTKLSFEVTDQDYFEWSPDGHYLLARLQRKEAGRYCLNLYDVDSRTWVNEKPISCTVYEASFSSDSTQIAYASNNKTNGALWLYSLSDGTSEELYRTTGGNELYPSGISDIHWSPTQTYLTFVSYSWIMGGTLNDFVVMNVETQYHFTVQGAAAYYASYNPIWSADDRWFLITLKEEYVTSSTINVTNHEGDVYLVNAESGEENRLTYTPAVFEGNVQWTDDGRIAFTVYTEKRLTFTTEQAMQVVAVPQNEIVMPEDIDIEAYYESVWLSDVMVSPDPHLGAWVSSIPNQSGEYDRELNVGSLLSMPHTAKFSVLIPDSYQYSNILIGWRPSDYPYPLG